MTDATHDHAAERQDTIEQKLEDRYRLSIDALLCDGVFCDADAAVLKGFQTHLGLTDEVAAEMFNAQPRV